MSAEKDLFKPELVFFDMEADSTDELFEKLGQKLDKMGYINDGWLEGISTRERKYPTGLAFPAAKIAIPHTDPEYIKIPYIVVIKPAKPIVFNHMAGAGDPVSAELIINLGVLRDGGQVETLQTLMNVFNDEDLVSDIMGQTTPEGMVEAFMKNFR